MTTGRFALDEFANARRAEATDLSTMLGYTLQPEMAGPLSAVPQGGAYPAPTQPQAQPTPQQMEQGPQPQPIQPPTAAPVRYPSSGGFDLENEIQVAADEAGIDPAIFRRLVMQESAGDQNARSNKGAIGLTQLMPDTANELGVDPTDPVQNLKGGARYYRRMLDKYGTSELALAAYNAGPGNVDRYGGVPPFAETQSYVNRILGRGGNDRFASEAQRPSGPNPYTPDQVMQARGPIDAIRAYMRGEAAPELDFRSGLQALGMGLGQISHGQSVDIEAVLNRQERYNERRRAEAIQKAERKAGAAYLWSQGNTDAAAAVASGGISVNDAMSEEDRKFMRQKMLRDDARTEQGRVAITQWGLDQGFSPEKAAALAVDPSAVLGQEQFNQLLSERIEARDKEARGRQALAKTYEGKSDPASQQLYAMLTNPDIPLDYITQTYNLQLGQNADTRADSALGLNRLNIYGDLSLRSQAGERDAQRLSNETSNTASVIQDRAVQADLAQGAAERDNLRLGNETKNIASQIEDRVTSGQRDAARLMNESRNVNSEITTRDRTSNRADAQLNLDADKQAIEHMRYYDEQRAAKATGRIAKAAGFSDDVADALSAGGKPQDVLNVADQQKLDLAYEKDRERRKTVMKDVGELGDDELTVAAVMQYIDPTIGSLADAKAMMKKPEGTEAMQLYQQYKQEHPGEKTDILEFAKDLAQAKAVKIVNNVGGDAAADSVYGAADKGYVWARGRDGNVLTKTDAATGAQVPIQVPIGGGETEAKVQAAQAEVQQAAAALAEKNDASEGRADTVINKINQALDIVDRHPTLTTGLIGQWASQIGGTPGADFSAQAKTIGSNLKLLNLAEMKNQSSTGASGMGPLSDSENKTLETIQTNLEQSQSAPQLVNNLKELGAFIYTIKIKNALAGDTTLDAADVPDWVIDKMTDRQLEKYEQLLDKQGYGEKK